MKRSETLVHIPFVSSHVGMLLKMILIQCFTNKGSHYDQYVANDVRDEFEHAKG